MSWSQVQVYAFSPYQPKLIHLNPLPNSGPDLPEGSLGPKFTQIYLVYT